ncbi:MAG: glycosyltransferase family 4 protein [Spiribacter sp.]|nr:glycosyltransferase family 4 protein [Spiribacter sp.]
MSARQKKTSGPKVLIAAGNGHITEVEMIKGLRHSGVNIHAAFASTSPHLQALTDAGVPTRSLDLKGNADFRNALKVRGWIKDEQFEIVHGLANRQVANFIWASYGLPNKLIAYRGAIGHVSRWDPTCYIKWLSPRVNKIICVSQAVERDLAANGVNSAKLITIYKGHDLSWYAHLDREAARAAVKREFNIPNDALLIGMAANIRAVKGADLLVSALEALPGNVHALIIGDIRDKRLLDRVDRSAARGRIHCTGYRDEAASLIGALDINCAPSRGREGLTKTVIEGLAQGVPAVVSTAGGLPEMVDHGKSGYVFPIDDLRAFIQCLHELIESSDLRKTMGERGKTLLQQRFDVRATITSTSQLYKQLLLE